MRLQAGRTKRAFSPEGRYRAPFFLGALEGVLSPPLCKT